MKTSRLLFSMLAALGFSALAHAQDAAAVPGQRSPADLAAENFFKVFDDRKAAVDEARFDKLIKTGLTYLEQNPTHALVPSVVTALTSFQLKMADPSLAAYRVAYLGRLSAAVFELRYKEGLSAELRTIAAALDAATADGQTREKLNRDNLKNLREKIDALARLPGNAPFLAERERSYAEILTRGLNPATGEAQLRRLLNHPDQGVVAMAHDELNLVELRKAPYEMKFTALDGKECDLAALRGKVVGVVFLNVRDEASMKALTTIKNVHSQYRRQGFELVAVACDKAEDREVVAKFVKDNKVTWPVYFDGKGTENEAWAKLNVRRMPTVALFDQKGMLRTHYLRVDLLEGEVKRLLGVKDESAAMPPADDSGGGSRRRR